MSEYDSTLQALQQALNALQQRSPNRYDEGYREGYRACHAELQTRIRQVLNDTITHSLTSPAPSPVAPTPHPDTKKPQTKRQPAPARDQLLRDFLASHPGSTYGDLRRALGQYTAVRVYSLAERGEVRKDDEGRFWPTAPETGERHANG